MLQRLKEEITADISPLEVVLVTAITLMLIYGKEIASIGNDVVDQVQAVMKADPEEELPDERD